MFSICFGSALLAQTNPNDKVFITNETTINTEQLEYSPAFYEDGIVFISTKVAGKKYKIKDKRTNTNIMSIFISRRDDNGLLATPVPFAKELLSIYHEGPLTFDRTADNIYFTRNNVMNGVKKSKKDGMIKLNIYSAEWNKNSWGNLKSLPFNEDESNACHPSISVEGNRIYFSSDMDGGLGGMDLYYSELEGGTWGTPVNLGPKVNTDKDEVFPFIHADGTLYFASDGHLGAGGLDIHFTAFEYGEWKKPENLKSPINTSKDDFGFIVDRDKKNGYFSSNRDGGLGSDDIYSFYISSGNLDEVAGVEKPKLPMNMKVLAIDQGTGEPLTEVSVSHSNIDQLSLADALKALSQDNVNSDELTVKLNIGKNSTSGLTDRDGSYPVKLDRGNYIFIVEKEGYAARQIVVTEDSQLDELVISLSKADAMANNVNGTGNGTGTGSNNGTIGQPGTVYNPNGTNTGNPTTKPGYTVTSKDNVSIQDSGLGDTNSNNGNSSDPFASNNNGSNTTGTGSNNGGSTTRPNNPMIREGAVFQMPNIYYNFNDASIRPDAKIDLDLLLSFMNQNPSVELELASHTDSRGGTRYNKKLSQKRADNAVSYLVRKGIDPNRLTSVGYGESEIRNRCTDGVSCDEREHQYNRRSEVRITKMSNNASVQLINNPGDEGYPSSTNTGSGYVNTSPSTSTNTERFDSNDNTDFKIIAGTYKSYENAVSKLKRLRSLGFMETVIVNFSDSDFHYIKVATSYDASSAKSIVDDLKQYDIKSYIKGLED